MSEETRGTDARLLLQRYWIVRERDKELYFRIKRSYDSFKKFFSEQLGWRVIINEKVIKAEKIPARAEAFMGIADFTDTRDYLLLCSLLMFLEDKEDEEQFLLSELVSALEAQLREFVEVDWNQFTQRKSLVRVLKYAEEMGMLTVYEGSSDNLAKDANQEVLYENTGLSRYFAVSFSRDISNHTSYQDFELEQEREVDQDRGHYRINRVYRQLAAAPAMYYDDPDDPDYLYVKNQRQWVHKNLADFLGGSLHLHKNGVFFVLDEHDSFGLRHPRESMISELALLFSGKVREAVQAGRLTRQNNDFILLTRDQFFDLVQACRQETSAGWSKEYREMGAAKAAAELMNYLEDWLMLRHEESVDGEQLVLCPAVGKLTGSYPKDFDGTAKETQDGGTN